MELQQIYKGVSVLHSEEWTLKTRDLFNDALIISDYTASNIMMIVNCKEFARKRQWLNRGGVQAFVWRELRKIMKDLVRIVDS